MGRRTAPGPPIEQRVSAPPLPAQLGFERPLHALPTDPIARHVHAVEPLQVLLVDLVHVPGDVRHQVALRIHAPPARPHLEARDLVQVGLHHRALVDVQKPRVRTSQRVGPLPQRRAVVRTGRAGRVLQFPVAAGRPRPVGVPLQPTGGVVRAPSGAVVDMLEVATAHPTPQRLARRLQHVEARTRHRAVVADEVAANDHLVVPVLVFDPDVDQFEEVGVFLVVEVQQPAQQFGGVLAILHASGAHDEVVRLDVARQDHAVAVEDQPTPRRDPLAALLTGPLVLPILAAADDLQQKEPEEQPQKQHGQHHQRPTVVGAVLDHPFRRTAPHPGSDVIGRLCDRQGTCGTFR